eukprot:Hpha_TRINITY_DN14783_c0_g2::TRINITY_DN14783_c0_g2_i1::g.102574::m.102574
MSGLPRLSTFLDEDDLGVFARQKKEATPPPSPTIAEQHGLREVPVPEGQDPREQVEAGTRFLGPVIGKLVERNDSPSPKKTKALERGGSAAKMRRGMNRAYRMVYADDETQDSEQTPSEEEPLNTFPTVKERKGRKRKKQVEEGVGTVSDDDAYSDADALSRQFSCSSMGSMYSRGSDGISDAGSAMSRRGKRRRGASMRKRKRGDTRVGRKRGNTAVGKKGGDKAKAAATGGAKVRKAKDEHLLKGPPKKGKRVAAGKGTGTKAAVSGDAPQLTLTVDGADDQSPLSPAPMTGDWETDGGSAFEDSAALSHSDPMGQSAVSTPPDGGSSDDGKASHVKKGKWKGVPGLLAIPGWIAARKRSRAQKLTPQTATDGTMGAIKQSMLALGVQDDEEGEGDDGQSSHEQELEQKEAKIQELGDAHRMALARFKGRETVMYNMLRGMRDQRHQMETKMKNTSGKTENKIQEYEDRFEELRREHEAEIQDYCDTIEVLKFQLIQTKEESRVDEAAIQREKDLENQKRLEELKAQNRRQMLGLKLKISTLQSQCEQLEDENLRLTAIAEDGGVMEKEMKQLVAMNKEKDAEILKTQFELHTAMAKLDVVTQERAQAKAELAAAKEKEMSMSRSPRDGGLGVLSSIPGAIAGTPKVDQDGMDKSRRRQDDIETELRMVKYALEEAQSKYRKSIEAQCEQADEINHLREELMLYTKKGDEERREKDDEKRKRLEERRMRAMTLHGGRSDDGGGRTPRSRSGSFRSDAGLGDEKPRGRARGSSFRSDAGSGEALKYKRSETPVMGPHATPQVTVSLSPKGASAPSEHPVEKESKGVQMGGGPNVAEILSAKLKEIDAILLKAFGDDGSYQAFPDYDLTESKLKLHLGRVVEGVQRLANQHARLRERYRSDHAAMESLKTELDTMRRYSGRRRGSMSESQINTDGGEPTRGPSPRSIIHRERSPRPVVENKNVWDRMSSYQKHSQDSWERRRAQLRAHAGGQYAGVAASELPKEPQPAPVAHVEVLAGQLGLVAMKRPSRVASPSQSIRERDDLGSNFNQSILSQVRPSISAASGQDPAEGAWSPHGSMPGGNLFVGARAQSPDGSQFGGERAGNAPLVDARAPSPDGSQFGGRRVQSPLPADGSRYGSPGGRTPSPGGAGGRSPPPEVQFTSPGAAHGDTRFGSPYERGPAGHAPSGRAPPPGAQFTSPGAAHGDGKGAGHTPRGRAPPPGARFTSPPSGRAPSPDAAQFAGGGVPGSGMAPGTGLPGGYASAGPGASFGGGVAPPAGGTTVGHPGASAPGGYASGAVHPAGGFDADLMGRFGSSYGGSFDADLMGRFGGLVPRTGLADGAHADPAVARSGSPSRSPSPTGQDRTGGVAGGRIRHNNSPLQRAGVLEAGGGMPAAVASHPVPGAAGAQPPGSLRSGLVQSRAPKCSAGPGMEEMPISGTVLGAQGGAARHQQRRSEPDMSRTASWERVVHNVPPPVHLPLAGRGLIATSITGSDARGVRSPPQPPDIDAGALPRTPLVFPVNALPVAASGSRVPGSALGPSSPLGPRSPLGLSRGASQRIAAQHADPYPWSSTTETVIPVGQPMLLGDVLSVAGTAARRTAEAEFGADDGSPPLELPSVGRLQDVLHQRQTFAGAGSSAPSLHVASLVPTTERPDSRFERRTSVQSRPETKQSNRRPPSRAQPEEMPFICPQVLASSSRPVSRAAGTVEEQGRAPQRWSLRSKPDKPRSPASPRTTMRIPTNFTIPPVTDLHRGRDLISTPDESISRPPRLGRSQGGRRASIGVAKAGGAGGWVPTAEGPSFVAEQVPPEPSDFTQLCAQVGLTMRPLKGERDHRKSLKLPAPFPLLAAATTRTAEERT